MVIQHENFGPDIEVTAQAITRVVGSLSGDFVEQATIIGIAAEKAIARLRKEAGSQQVVAANDGYDSPGAA